MKKGIILLVILIVSIVSSAVVFGTDEKEIEVWIDDKKLQFEETPFIEDNKLFVPFRLLFNELGLIVNWDQETQTVLGTNDNFSIHLPLYSKQTIVNGETMEVEPKIVNNRTFVSIKFVVESIGAKVEWDDQLRIISVTSPRELEKQNEIERQEEIKKQEEYKKEISEMFDRYIEYRNDENLTGIESLLSDGFHQINSNVESLEYFETYDLEIELMEIDIQFMNQHYVANIETIEKVVNTNEAFYLDQIQDLSYTVWKTKEGSWQIDVSRLWDKEYITPESILNYEVDVPKDYEEEILKVLEDEIKYANEGNIEKYTSVYHDESPEITEENVQFLINVWSEFGYLSYENLLVSIVDFKENEAKVFALQNMVESPFYNTLSERAFIYTLEKSENDQWKIYQKEKI
ncbi:stalk domain-containing protein [Chengkuizengella axinellae]|uniref:Stalk domain-containing protein n=1 Tax=Chengkuizengella axinellae TaxID=3064388 RepID=A0ABT9J0N2_9BACL|nr:stalk domain-containing protein [Chengkuizengella sp. 2205SS18-9]MDP5275133.1 stalk domain-containing protein [Chengkuizengella sp. 2205SS18-9]